MEKNLEKTIANFRTEIENFTLEDLKKKADEIKDAISKMILDSDLMIKAAIVDTRIKELEKEEN